ncbi:hypothetical protein AXF42_Ash010737 [Apostasia shenzhenica]|uniref:RanBP2-type domain-containing protein n=1 Tax=Apostasia shenzhenica TaxID=1088818 RepID=A0A2I0A0H7_9ASPA|nr:hypothetical protein AXF42_Ash010737 [Apostasia shenzhenica]
MNRRPGDWNCRTCWHLNFSRREACQRCGARRIGDPRGSRPASRPVDVKPGDWYCSCGVHNFASRSGCFKCGALKVEAAALANAASAGAAAAGPSSFDCGIVPPDWKSGDWLCTRFGCNEHNFASRLKCFRCNAPREYQGDQ